MRGMKPETNGNAKLSKVVMHNNTWHKMFIILLTISMLYCHIEECLKKDIKHHVVKKQSLIIVYSQMCCMFFVMSRPSPNGKFVNFVVTTG